MRYEHVSVIDVFTFNCLIVLKCLYRIGYVGVSDYHRILQQTYRELLFQSFPTCGSLAASSDMGGAEGYFIMRATASQTGQRKNSGPHIRSVR